MDEQVVHFHSDGFRLEASLYRMSDSRDRTAAIVFCPGSRVSRRTPYYADYVQAFVAAGFVVLLIDYRGWGGSEGRAGTLSPWSRSQISAMRSRS